MLPPLVEHISAALGWHEAFYLFAAGLILFVLPLVLALVRDDPATSGVRPTVTMPWARPPRSTTRPPD